MIEESPLREKKKKKDYPEENVLQLHEERSLHFLSFDKIKECGCTDRDWRETFILSMFCSNVFISSFRDEKTASNTLSYVASEKTSTEIFCGHTETELPGQAALLALVQLLWELGGGGEGPYTLHAGGRLVPLLVLKGKLEEMVWGKAGWLHSRFALICRARMLWQLDGGRREVKIKAPLKGRGGAAFLMGQRSFITSRDVMLNKPQST